MVSTTMWNPLTHADYDALAGMDAYSRDGEKVGTIRGVYHPDLDMPAARGRHYFLLDPGPLRDWFGGHDEAYLPETAIAAVGTERVVLSLDKEQVQRQGWTTKPAIEGLRFRPAAAAGPGIAPAGRSWGVREGDAVHGADGEKLGKVVAVQPGYVVVEKGFFFPTDYYVPTGAIASYDDGKVYLNVTKDAALTQGWDVVPTAGLYETDVVATGTATAGAAVGYESDVARADAGWTGTARVTEGETLRVPVHEEELAATTREREIGRVRVEKDVVAEERTIDVPVTEERVRVERRVVDRPAEAGEAAFEEGVIAVPIRGEEVELQRRVRVAEEIEIGKEAVRRTERVGGTVRREEVRVTEDVTGAAEANR